MNLLSNRFLGKVWLLHETDLTGLSWAPQMLFLKFKRNDKARLSMTCSRDFWHVAAASIQKNTFQTCLQEWNDQYCAFGVDLPTLLRYHWMELDIVIPQSACNNWAFWHVWKWKHSWERGWWVKISPFIQSWSPFTDSVGGGGLK